MWYNTLDKSWSYYNDADTGFYYLQSRYYDPNIGRFINADSYAATGHGFVGYNMFAYCYNYPIGMADYYGKDAIYITDYRLDGGLPIVGHAIVYGYISRILFYQTTMNWDITVG